MALQDNGDRCACPECRLDRMTASPDACGLATDRVAGREELDMPVAWHAAFGAVVIVSYTLAELTTLYGALEELP
jgi:hypothetical protein